MVKKFRIRVNGREYKVEVEEVVEGGIVGDDKKRRSMETKDPQKTTEATKEGERIVCSPMPAKVIKVVCKVGERVRKGDILIILEAMKMENEIISPFDGIIKDVKATEGMNVSHNEAMVVFE